MRRIKTILIMIAMLALAGYVVYLNMELKKTANQYESSAVEMANRFEKVNEDALKAREELARQIVLTEEAKAAAEAVRAEAEKAANAIKAEAAVAVDERPVEPVKLTAKERSVYDAKIKAENAKAAAEAMLEQSVGAAKNAWETREAHL